MQPRTMLGAMLESELGGRDWRKIVYTWGQIRKISSLVCTVLITCPLLVFVDTIFNFKTPKFTIVSMYEEIYIRPDHEVMISASWKIDELARLDIV